jgi:hypothetical protein
MDGPWIRRGLGSAKLPAKSDHVPSRPEHFTQAGVSQEEFQVFVVHSLHQVAPSAGVLVYPESEAEGNGEQDGEQRSGRVPCNTQRHTVTKCAAVGDHAVQSPPEAV